MKAHKTQPRPAAAAAPALPEIPNWLCLSLLAALTLAIFSETLFVHPGDVLSDPRMDLHYFFIHWRYFGFHELKSGNLALWNPHCAGAGHQLDDCAACVPGGRVHVLLDAAPGIAWPGLPAVGDDVHVLRTAFFAG
jgi:hypothetical protein